MAQSLNEQFSTYIQVSHPTLKETSANWHMMFLIWLDGYLACIKDTSESETELYDLPSIAGQAGHEKLVSELTVSNVLAEGPQVVGPLANKVEMVNGKYQIIS
jgi:hypothetical protein